MVLIWDLDKNKKQCICALFDTNFNVESEAL